ncbi:MAG: hypothetical protein M3Q16_02095 [Pseudomonadota bacterium]|nr:hypothetical protein [Pseudomonadota bacterium]
MATINQVELKRENSGREPCRVDYNGKFSCELSVIFAAIAAMNSQFNYEL